MISPRQISKHGPTYSEFEKIVILKYISKGLYFFFFSDQTWYDGQTVALRFNWGGKHIGAAGGGYSWLKCYPTAFCNQRRVIIFSWFRTPWFLLKYSAFPIKILSCIYIGTIYI